VTVLEFLDAVIAESRDAIPGLDLPHLRRGALTGLAICSRFVEPQDFLVCLTERKQHLAALLASRPFEYLAYEEYRCGTTQIMKIFAVMCVAWNIPPVQWWAVVMYNHILASERSPLG